MKGIRYKVEISDDIMSYIHNMKHFIDEIAIKELKTIVNECGVHFFSNNEDFEFRMKGIKDEKEIDIPLNIFDVICEIKRAKEKEKKLLIELGFNKQEVSH